MLTTHTSDPLYNTTIIVSSHSRYSVNGYKLNNVLLPMKQRQLFGDNMISEMISQIF